MNRFYFFHIEKAAGTSFHEYVRKNIFQYHVLEPTLFTDDLTYTSKRIQNKVSNKLFFLFMLRGIGGHCLSPRMCLSDKDKEKNLYFTILRDPRSRTVSHFYYQNEVMGKNWSFAEFISNPCFQNFMCRKISGKPSFLESKVVLDDLGTVVGIMENMDESLQLLQKEGAVKGLGFSGRIAERNVRASRVSNRSELTEKDLELLEIHNQEDVKLYEYYQLKLGKTLDQQCVLSIDTDLLNLLPNKCIYFTNSILSKSVYRVTERVFRKIFPDR